MARGGGTGPNDRGDGDLGGLLREHLAIVVAALPVALALVRVALLSNFDVTTAKAVLQSLSPIQVILGTLVDAGPYLLFAAGAALFLISLRQAGAGRYALAIVGVPMVLVVLLNAHLWIALVLALASVAASIAYARHAVTQTRHSILPVFLVIVIAVPVVGSWLTGASSWLPEERIAIEGRDPVVGYVLNAGADWTTVLLTSSERVVHFRSERVRNRTLCNEHATARSLLDLIRGEEGSSYPDC